MKRRPGEPIRLDRRQFAAFGVYDIGRAAWPVAAHLYARPAERVVKRRRAIPNDIGLRRAVPGDPQDPGLGGQAADERVVDDLVPVEDAGRIGLGGASERDADDAVPRRASDRRQRPSDAIGTSAVYGDAFRAPEHRALHAALPSLARAAGLIVTPSARQGVVFHSASECPCLRQRYASQAEEILYFGSRTVKTSFFLLGMPFSLLADYFDFGGDIAETAGALGVLPFAVAASLRDSLTDALRDIGLAALGQVPA